jgi:mono/diheme cytochrome c family protein
MKTEQRQLPQRVTLGEVCCSVALILGVATPLVGARRVIAQAAPQAPKQTQAPAGDGERGRKLFVKDGCYQCHGTEAQGGGYTGPRLAPPAPPLALLLSQVRHPTGDMPPFETTILPDKDVRDIYAFLQSIPNPPALDTIPILRSSK